MDIVLQVIGPGRLGMAVAALLGLSVGSFANVLIHRTPREGLTVFRPSRSFCPGCGNQLGWSENVPVFSWLMQRGRCRSCKMGIAWRYPLVELVVGLAFVAAWWQLPAVDAGTAVRLCVAWYLSTLVIVVTAIDLELQIIPDVITKPGMAIAFLGSLAFPAIHDGHAGFQPDSPHSSALLVAIGGALAGGGVLWAIGALGNMVARRVPSMRIAMEEAGIEDTMGWGDVKWMAMGGAFLGAPLALDAVFVAALLGGSAGLALKLAAALRRTHAPPGLPFGPFLGVAILLELVEPHAAWNGLQTLSGLMSGA